VDREPTLPAANHMAAEAGRASTPTTATTLCRRPAKAINAPFTTRSASLNPRHDPVRRIMTVPKLMDPSWFRAKTFPSFIAYAKANGKITWRAGNGSVPTGGRVVQLETGISWFMCLLAGTARPLADLLAEVAQSLFATSPASIA